MNLYLKINIQFMGVADCMVAIKSVTKLQNNVISRTAGALGYTVMFDMLEIGP